MPEATRRAGTVRSLSSLVTGIRRATVPDFTESLAEEFMDRIEVETAVWSITACVSLAGSRRALTPSSPGPSIAGTGEAARKLATACNQECAPSGSAPHSRSSGAGWLNSAAASRSATASSSPYHHLSTWKAASPKSSAP